MKKIISFALRTIPRKYLQLFSHVVLRIVAIFYKGNKVQCTVCDSTFRSFLPYGRAARANALCPNCLALERHRLIWLYLKEKTSFFEEQLHFLHIAPEICFIDRFEKLPNLGYITADIESPLAKVKMDIHQIPFEANTFDASMCNHVLEHVNNDLQAMSELFRVLKPGGWAILQVPFFFPLEETTIEDPTEKDPKVRERKFGQDDHVRKYGKDYADRIRSVGFEVIEDDFVNTFSQDIQKRFGLPVDETIYFCQKPKD